MLAPVAMPLTSLVAALAVFATVSKTLIVALDADDSTVLLLVGSYELMDHITIDMIQRARERPV